MINTGTIGGNANKPLCDATVVAMPPVPTKVVSVSINSVLVAASIARVSGLSLLSFSIRPRHFSRFCFASAYF